MTPPSSSSEGGPGRADAAVPDGGAGEAPGEDLQALTARIAVDFGADAATLAAVAAMFAEVRDRAPDLFVPVAGVLGTALAEAASAGTEEAAAPLYAALGEWALDAEAEPIERMRRDCLRFQGAMTRGALRLHAGDPERCAARLLALQRFNFLQLALLAALAARSQEEGGVVRTLPTPEYAAFMEIFRTTIEAHRQEGKQLGLLLIQVAKVEQVDRLLGLQRGEAFMLRVTRRMREGVLRRQDQLGRVSRDQFACLLPRIAGEGVAILAANKVLAALEAPIPIGERSFAPDAVIGVAVFPDHGGDPQTLVRNGKLAVRAAREAADRVAVYEAAHGESEELTQRYEARLRAALEESALAVAFEPQLDLASGAISGLEGSLRWSDRELGEVSETRAVETAEHAGLTRELTWWFFMNALRQCAEFARGGLDLPVGLKVAASGLAQPDFPEFIDRALRTWGVPAERLTVEIHESALAGPVEQVRATLERLKSLGVKLAVDGFGTGASAVASLARLPLDEMKLAAEFVSDMRRVPLHAKIVRSLALLARNLDLRVTAEGVADAETALALSTLGCHRVQGTHVGPPLAPREVLARCVAR
ncbi:MAG: phosphodiesterase [Burkholderiales bacterium]|nr:phosphodiesterase [Burkholderiales bacterium]